MSVSEVARSTGITRAGARRLLLTLHSLGYLRTDGRRFSLAPKTLELGYSFLSSRGWLSIASPLLETLKTTLSESVSVTMLEDTDVVYVARFQADRVMTVSMDVGSRRPAYCTAMGRVLLGELPEPEARAILDRSELVAHTPRTLVDKEALMEEFRKARRQGLRHRRSGTGGWARGRLGASSRLQRRRAGGGERLRPRLAAHARRPGAPLSAGASGVRASDLAVAGLGLAREGPQHDSEAGRQGRRAPRRGMARPVGRSGQHEEPRRSCDKNRRRAARRRKSSIGWPRRRDRCPAIPRCRSVSVRFGTRRPP